MDHNTIAPHEPPSSADGKALDIDTVNDAAEAMLADLELSPLTKTTYRHGLHALVRYFHLTCDAYDEADASPLPHRAH